MSGADAVDHSNFSLLFTYPSRNTNSLEMPCTKHCYLLDTFDVYQLPPGLIFECLEWRHLTLSSTPRQPDISANKILTRRATLQPPSFPTTRVHGTNFGYQICSPQRSLCGATHPFQHPKEQNTSWSLHPRLVRNISLPFVSHTELQ